MNDIRLAQACFQVLRRVGPEGSSLVQGRMSFGTTKLRAIDPAGGRFPFRVPEKIPECRVKNIFVFQINPGKLLDYSVRKISASSLAAARLADVKTDSHKISCLLFTTGARSPQRHRGHRENQDSLTHSIF